MDESDQILLFVNEYCNQMATIEKNRRSMYAWYCWSDKRVGSIEERFDLDAKSWAEYQKIWGKQ